MQDNAASTTVLGYKFGGTINGTLNGGDNTDAIDDTGPYNWIPKGLHLNGTDDYINLGSVGAIGGDNATMLAMIKLDAEFVGAGTAGFGVFGESFVAGAQSLYPWTDNNIYNSTWRGTGAGTVSRITVGNPAPAYAGWRQICVKTTPVAGGWKFRVDGSNINTATGITGLYTSSGTWEFGRSGAGTMMDGLIAHLAIFSRHLSDSEEAETFAGPEPVNTVAPVVTGTTTLSCTTGTWALPSPLQSGTNGTITYSYQWTRSDTSGGSGEVDIGGETSSTYSPGIADAGKFVGCRVRATNDGGFDSAADTTSNRVQTGNRRRRTLLMRNAA